MNEGLVAVDYKSYAHFQERIDRENAHLPEAERDALIAGHCLKTQGTGIN